MSTDQREIFCRIMVLNEALYGQQYDRLRSLMQQVDVSLSIDFSRYYICLTGLPKRFYANRLGMTRDDYNTFFNTLQVRVADFFAAHNCAFEYTVIQYNHSKQVCVLFSPPPGKDLAFSAAEYIHQEAEGLYAQNPLYASSGLFNTTVLSPLLCDYALLEQAYQDLLHLSRLSFFLMRPAVLTREIAQSLCTPYSVAEALNLLHALETQVSAGNAAEANSTLRRLLLSHIAGSFDFVLLGDVLTEIRKHLLRYSKVYGLGLEDTLETVFSLKQYPTIAELTDAVLALLGAGADAAVRSSLSLSAISLEAAYFIQNNYARNISLQDVASHVNVSPNYLSRVFNKELCQSVPEYLARTRVNSAARLLEAGSLKAVEIGQAVGIENAQYFGALFKKYTGFTPQEYRRLYGFGAKQ